MKSFVKIELGDTVFDTVHALTGTVLNISHSTNTAEVRLEMEDENEIITSRLSDLVVINAPKPEHKTNVNHDTNKWFNLVKVFHGAFDHPIADKPTQLTLGRATNRSIWTGEEALVEFLH